MIEDAVKITADVLNKKYRNRRYLPEGSTVYSNGCYLTILGGKMRVESLEDDTYYNGKIVYEDECHPGMYYTIIDPSLEEE